VRFLGSFLFIIFHYLCAFLLFLAVRLLDASKRDLLEMLFFSAKANPGASVCTKMSQ